jgi:hypothetical protein
MVTAAELRRKAAQCRRLAAAIDDADPAAISLMAMADEFDARAREMDARTGMTGGEPPRHAQRQEHRPKDSG